MKNASVVDVFCGIGGLTHGFIKEGFNVIAGIDADRSCKYAYEKNNDATFIHQDIEDGSTSKTIMNLFPSGHTKILIGCAPCTPFSNYSRRGTKDRRWGLLYSFLEIIRIVQPEIVSMENVAQLEKHQVFDDFVQGLEEANYNVSWQLVDCRDFGIPQKRVRLVLLASMLGGIELIKKTHPPSKIRTVRDVIGKLDPIEAGETSSRDRLHTARGLTMKNKRRIAITPPGGGWIDWPEELLLDCHKKESGRTYRSVYGRMLWDEPSPTLTTHCVGLGNGRFGHPEQDRAISLREAAMLQTFPKYYEFLSREDKLSVKSIATQIGNAVPVRLARIIARSVKCHMEFYHA